MDNQFANEVQPITIEKELKQSYLDYAMSVIIGRALPDIRDGLKPVHRRTLYAMKELGNDFNKAYKKSARVVGDVIGKYHPHGDTAVYDTIVRMAQPFSLRYMLVDGQGNFGSIDGDAPAAMRYTEIRMSKVAHSLLVDIDKETVDFSPNYDGTENIPDVLPTRVPNLLVNGSSGIAVGMATNIPPHNLSEVLSAVIALINDPALCLEELMQHIQGPDFPTAAYINGRSGIIDAYRTGKGRVIMRSKVKITDIEKGSRQQIVITELPYQVNKAKLVEKIAELVKEKKIEGISELRDESDKDGLRVVIDVKKNESAEVILNNLYAQTQLQSSFSVNMVALIDGRPKLLPLKEILEAFINHRKEVVTRRTIFELRKAKERAHLLEGLAVALSNIDEMIAIIKTSKTSAQAKESLLEKQWNGQTVIKMLTNTDRDFYRIDGLAKHYGLHGDKYYLSQSQVDAILELKLHRLTGLEQEKILNEFQELLNKIDELILILKDTDQLLFVIIKELEAIKEQFGDDRRSEIITSQLDLEYEDLIPEEQMVVTQSHDGYVKRQPLSDYNAQRRGGKGKLATQMKSEDFVHSINVASTHDMMLCFSSLGKIYWSKIYQLPSASRNARGKPINNILPLDKDEKITVMLAVKEFSQDNYVFMATRKGITKRVALSLFSKPRKGGIHAISIDQDDSLEHAMLTDGNKDIMMFSNAGKAIRFHENEVRSVGRSARGVRGMKLQENQIVVALVSTRNLEDIVLTITENGFGKRTSVAEYRKTARGSQGVISISTSDRNGQVVSAGLVEDTDDVMLVTDMATLVRFHVNEVRQTGRSAQGVKLINLKKDEKLVTAQIIQKRPELCNVDNIIDSNLINQDQE